MRSSKAGKALPDSCECEKPYREETQRQVKELETKFGVAAMAVNCDQLRKEDILHMLERCCMSFRFSRWNFIFPNGWSFLPMTIR